MHHTATFSLLGPSIGSGRTIDRTWMQGPGSTSEIAETFALRSGDGATMSFDNRSTPGLSPSAPRLPMGFRSPLLLNRARQPILTSIRQQPSAGYSAIAPSSPSPRGDTAIGRSTKFGA